MDNVFEILMIPGQWSYESMEAWYPGTVWNPNGTSIAIFSDWEGNSGRTTYAAIGGCYYSARLAICEQLEKERRQATAIVLAKPDQDTSCLSVSGKSAKTYETPCAKNPTYSKISPNRFNSSAADLKFQCNGGSCKANC